MKILKELILNGECIVNDVPELSNIKFKLDYDSDNNAFKITIYQIDLTKSPSLNERKKALQKLAEKLDEEYTGSISFSNRSLKLESAHLTINHHGVEWLSKQEDFTETIELLKLFSRLQKSTLVQIKPDLLNFLTNKESTHSSSKKNSELDSYEYIISEKFSQTYRLRLLKIYSMKLSELLRTKYPYEENETTGLCIKDDPILIISQIAKSRLMSIFNPQMDALATLSPLTLPRGQFTPNSNSSRHTLSGSTSTPANNSPSTLHRKLEPISSVNIPKINIDLDLLFSTGEILIKLEENNYIASYSYELDLEQITIHVKKENQSNIVKDELSPRSLNCQRLVEIIHHEIIHKYPLPIDTKIILNKSDCTMVLPKRVVEKILVNQDSESSSRIIKTMNNLNKPDTIESNNLLLEITSNKHKYFRCMLVGDKYEITCESGNTQFKENPGITLRISSQLSWLVLNNFNSLVSDKYPDLHNSVDMRSLICEKPPANGFTFMINKKACDDVLLTKYLKSLPEIAMVTPQIGLTLENAKNQLNAFLAPFKDRYLISANLTDIKARISNSVRCLVTWMSETDLDMVCQFYEYLKTPDIFKYINAHKNPIYDSIFSKNNTDTWQKIMKLLKDYALALLKSKAAEFEGSTNDKETLLVKYRNHPIFTDHRLNRFSNKFHNTHAVNEIDKLISSYRLQQNELK